MEYVLNCNAYLPFLHAKQLIQGGEKSIFMVVIH